MGQLNSCLSDCSSITIPYESETCIRKLVVELFGGADVSPRYHVVAVLQVPASDQVELPSVERRCDVRPTDEKGKGK
jgi:hypothetical protein